MLQPREFTTDDRLEVILDPDQERATVVYSSCHAASRTGGRAPRHARAAARRCAASPAVEDSIEPAGEQIAVASCTRRKRLGAHRRPVDGPSERCLERGR